MNKFLTLAVAQRRSIFEQTAVRKHLPVRAVEKDFWVTEILNILSLLPYADKIVFKGGTSLSKVWNVIKRFSEDIDIVVDRSLFGIEGDVTKKQLKKLRKESSLFVRDTLVQDLIFAIEKVGLSEFFTVIPDPDGEGDAMYPEPRQIHVFYQSVFPIEHNVYLRDEVLLEVGARSLFEPTAIAKVESFVTEMFPHLTSRNLGTHVVVAVAEKTFLEKAFLLHELFSTDGCQNANRKSRHLYDLYKMIEIGIVDKAISNDNLWEAIRHHREIFTPVRDVDYSWDVRSRICLLPPEKVRSEWRKDYESMVENMIYDDVVPSFDQIIEAMKQLQNAFQQSLL
ncbi:putative nucleotidyltransferase component of viral defense system [Parabacteroides sp. PFB2-12]|uniref:nucleotidyl transferase AbiEii/AbiGii toxin family protein n=1 Tax=unclassified Parabacteroides TaxID=2649774 RepID=UPI00247420C3|nr:MULTISPECIES: nucleotidyl transferase AbiEii/AbiGii toxin family protein [unclassified Parabacteroides]MDH6343702.1 putative nucleotidyltransferase component of viral defense system [Parabacteroides sp. PM6-13]MDH6391338.1 putative nucleotidyltransferase component of viral defense system [Parabacteroides sp. PFB2-12]